MFGKVITQKWRVVVFCYWQELTSDFFAMYILCRASPRSVWYSARRLAYCDTHEWYANLSAEAAACLHTFKAVLSRTWQCTCKYDNTIKNVSSCEILSVRAQHSVSMHVFLFIFFVILKISKIHFLHSLQPSTSANAEDSSDEWSHVLLICCYWYSLYVLHVYQQCWIDSVYFWTFCHKTQSSQFF